MTIKVFADGADMEGIIEAASLPVVKGFTTNPTLMKQAGVTDYTKFAERAIKYLRDTRPDTCLSLEVFSDHPNGMIKQARIISDWGIGTGFDYPVYVKIPITNTSKLTTRFIVRDLLSEGVRVNVTAVFTLDQVKGILDTVDRTKPLIISVFAGRIADTGINPVKVIDEMFEYWADTLNPGMPVAKKDAVEFLWASCREPFHYKMAELAGCDIITMPLPMIKKLSVFDKDLTEFSLDTVKMFYQDAAASGFTIGE